MLSQWCLFPRNKNNLQQHNNDDRHKIVIQIRLCCNISDSRATFHPVLFYNYNWSNIQIITLKPLTLAFRRLEEHNYHKQNIPQQSFSDPSQCCLSFPPSLLWFLSSSAKSRFQGKKSLVLSLLIQPLNFCFVLYIKHKIFLSSMLIAIS